MKTEILAPISISFIAFLIVLTGNFNGGVLAHAEEVSPCAEGTAQGLMKCGEDAISKAEVELKEVYSKLLASLPSSAESSGNKAVTKSKVMASQKAWEKSRDINCKIRADLLRSSWQWESGKFDLCRAYSTEQRTKELELWLGCVLNEEDDYGPVCGAL